ncbi:MAG: adenylosuccinate synthetase, partial [Candidatus Omnitrophota bacterium]
GPFPTEFSPEFSDFIRNKGREFGATTGRPRRCGWFDSVLVRRAVLLNGITELALTKMDILDGLQSLQIATAYKYKGKLFREFPSDYEILARARPVYKEVRGWTSPTTNIRRYKNLPANAKSYISILEDMLKTKISIVSVGSSRDDTIFL